MWRDVIFVISVIGMIAVALILGVYNIVWHFQYPDMTETRLFLTHWKEYTGMFVLFVFFVVGYGWSR